MAPERSAHRISHDEAVGIVPECALDGRQVRLVAVRRQLDPVGEAGAKIVHKLDGRRSGSRSSWSRRPEPSTSTRRQRSCPSRRRRLCASPRQSSRFRRTAADSPSHCGPARHGGRGRSRQHRPQPGCAARRRNCSVHRHGRLSASSAACVGRHALCQPLCKGRRRLTFAWVRR